ncbi:MAG: hypothetical protein ACTHJZ_23020 [Trinickia sp.]|uniref:hypothetical protein n=1 Tax=Trinickia sp. TaxID=2571163 RepID=UPI003F7EC507
MIALLRIARVSEDVFKRIRPRVYSFGAWLAPLRSALAAQDGEAFCRAHVAVVISSGRATYGSPSAAIFRPAFTIRGHAKRRVGRPERMLFLRAFEQTFAYLVLP